MNFIFFSDLQAIDRLLSVWLHLQLKIDLVSKGKSILPGQTLM